MSMQLRIKHVTGYRYEKGAVASFNEARMTPVSTSAQSVLAARVTVEPVSWTYTYRDYWDTQVTAFDVEMAFFFHNSDLDKTVAFYPGPAGATECLLDLRERNRIAVDAEGRAELEVVRPVRLVPVEDQRLGPGARR